MKRLDAAEGFVPGILRAEALWDGDTSGISNGFVRSVARKMLDAAEGFVTEGEIGYPIRFVWKNRALEVGFRKPLPNLESRIREIADEAEARYNETVYLRSKKGTNASPLSITVIIPRQG